MSAAAVRCNSGVDLTGMVGTGDGCGWMRDGAAGMQGGRNEWGVGWVCKRWRGGEVWVNALCALVRVCVHRDIAL